MKRFGLFGIVMMLAIGLVSVNAQAHGKSKSRYITVEVGITKPMRIKATPDLVLIGNPAVVDVIIEKDNRLFLVGLSPGRTSFRVYNSGGKLILNMPIVVTRQRAQHVIVHRGNRESTVSCADSLCTRVPTQRGRGFSSRPAGVSVAGAAAGSGGRPELEGDE